MSSSARFVGPMGLIWILMSSIRSSPAKLCLSTQDRLSQDDLGSIGGPDIPQKEPPMRPSPQGNGSGKFEIGHIDMGGWVRVFPAKSEESAGQDLSVFLSQTLSEWVRQKPHLRMKCVIP